jgi:hypothetical protein
MTTAAPKPRPRKKPVTDGEDGDVHGAPYQALIQILNWLAQDWARWAGEYHLSTGGRRELADQPLHVLYELGVAWLAREAEKTAQQRDVVDATLDNLDPPERVEQTRREDGMLEHNPDMEVPGWGYSDSEDMPGLPASVSASGGAVDGFDPS